MLTPLQGLLLLLFVEVTVICLFSDFSELILQSLLFCCVWPLYFLFGYLSCHLTIGQRFP